ncbi:hypothetical protein N7495_009759 [Penicillium taxi]|uniref:uncharacterized protein n=1 Tax=Penicillium taxi TaxID=168475 RepID=UPI002545050D|nr:uncharacterized protein N7495_009759 [Penicillium taxi]KAJ5885249.1 hypothetical protein N7495_009759 [Penicillium taxi]
MGIKGLHGLLKSIQKPCHIKSFDGQTLAIDAYGWLHRGTVACSVDLVLEKQTRKHIDFVLHRVRMLLFFGVKPYLVFDGDNLPSKAGTEQERHLRRQESKSLGLELQRKGRITEAYQEFQKAVDVTPYMARQLIEELKKMNVQYVVAPYEADPQMVYLEQLGIVDGIISEDSDLLVFGAKRLLSKLDQHGDCIEINRADFTACRDVSLVGWSDADFRHMCILSGCDYLANIPKMGLKTAYRSIRKYKTVERVLQMLKFDGQYKIPDGYLANFMQAEHTFIYQRVFCPEAKKLVTLTVPEEGVNLEEMPFIGADVEAAIAVGVACGDLDPMTKEIILLKQPLTQGKHLLGLTRRQTLGSSSELKPRKPINTFFTPKRQPLAELDPNTLTPSPSQQSLLERNANNSWQPDSVPFLSNSSARMSTPFRAFSDQGLSPMIRSVERNTSLAHAARASQQSQPWKRQRLCSEADDDALPARSEARSRFFCNTLTDSPTGQKVLRTKKQRKSMLDVFSDEVAEEIFSGISESQSSVESVGTHATSRHDAPTEVSGSEIHSDNIAVPQSEDPDSTNATEFNQALQYNVKPQKSTVLSKFTFKARMSAEASGSESGIPMVSSNDKPVSVSPRTPSRGAQIKTHLGQHSRLTPLQRLGQTALSRAHTISFPTKLRQIDSQTKELPDTKPTPVAQGSEDHIVPDSEDEEELDTTEQTSTLDLKRFSFAAK